MSELLLINPKKRTRKMAVRKRRSAAQKAATRKLVALNRRRRKSPTRRKRRSNPRARPAMKTYVTNPRRRRRAPTKRRSVRRRRSNPAQRMTMAGLMNRNVMPAFQGGAGALGLDIIWGYMPIPVNLKTGMLRHVIKGAGAIAMGWIAGNFVKPATATQLATGALTVVMHSAMRETVAQFAPNIPLGEYVEGMGYYNAGEIASPQYGNNELGQVPYGSSLTPMGEYMPDDGNMSYYESGVEGDMMGMGVGVYE